MKVINKTKDIVLAEDAMMANTSFKRMRGLLGRKEFLKGQALILKPCNSIHTFFMRFPIDVLFVDRENKIVALKSNLQPWRVSPIYWQVKFVVELPREVIVQSSTCKGDEITII